MKVAAFLIALAVFGACSAGNETPTPLADRPIDESAVLRLVTSDDFAGVDGINVSAQNVLEFLQIANPDEAQGLDAWFAVRVTSNDGPESLIAIKRFATSNDANQELDKTSAGNVFTTMEEPLGDRSAIASTNPETGAAVVFVDGRTFVNFLLPATLDGAVLLDDDQLLALARKVADRL